MATESEGGVFISTEKIYEQLLEMNTQLALIRSDFRSVNEQNHQNSETLKDHENRIRGIEQTKKDRTHPSLQSAAVSAVVAILVAIVSLLFR